MLATLTDRRFSDPAWLYERKLGDERCLAFGRRRTVMLRSHNGNVVGAAYPELVAALEQCAAADDFVIDGEIVAFAGHQTSFQLLQRRIHVRSPSEQLRSEVPVFHHVFDLLHLDGHDVTRVELRDRKRLLRDAFRFEDPLRALHERLRELETDSSPFASAGTARRDAAGAPVHWVRPEPVAQIDFSEWTADGRLRHPRCIGLRDDKAPREVVRERAAG